MSGAEMDNRERLQRSKDSKRVALLTIKTLHTVIWAFFAGCIVAIPILGWAGKYLQAAVVSGIVMLEVSILMLNGWRCPLTPMAARYTDDRRDNFDIYLPRWLARHNKVIFGTLYVAGMLVTVALWIGGV